MIMIRMRMALTKFRGQCNSSGRIIIRPDRYDLELRAAILEPSILDLRIITNSLVEVLALRCFRTHTLRNDRSYVLCHDCCVGIDGGGFTAFPPPNIP